MTYEILRKQNTKFWHWHCKGKFLSCIRLPNIVALKSLDVFFLLQKNFEFFFLSFLHILTLKLCCDPFPQHGNSLEARLLIHSNGSYHSFVAAPCDMGEEVLSHLWGKKKITPLSRVKWPWCLAVGESPFVFLFYKKAESPVLKCGINH